MLDAPTPTGKEMAPTGATFCNVDKVERLDAVIAKGSERLAAGELRLGEGPYALIILFAAGLAICAEIDDVAILASYCACTGARREGGDEGEDCCEMHV